MIDHMGLLVSDRKASKAFYTAIFAPLGYRLIVDESYGSGFGINKPDFWLVDGMPLDLMHVAFQAQSRAAVDAFHKIALAAGGANNGAPGIREHYHPNYYGAFVLDPDEHNIEAVCHKPE
ncbi:VOC family protein [Asticcacaulis sp. AC402]|uniref:VOC family protein n=1 Tax=Asticcacaulis sp. AC402 TaxID=1282361 RepID=UPI0003C3BF1D|nr:VOC family protein [Asticcacaulis sp. AC402]ESQ75004.1 glyoxalase [Asticcacaulis sp. AC402]